MLHFSTTEHALHVVGLQAGDGELAAPSEPPPVAEGADTSLRIHESMINNLSLDALSGRTIYEERVQAAVTNLLGHLPDKMKGDEDGLPWAITFARRQPISVNFADEGFKVTIRGVRYHKGNNSLLAMNIAAAYKIEKSPTGFKAVRQGAIGVFPPDFVPGGGRQLDAQRETMCILLKHRFAKVSSPNFSARGSNSPGNGRRPARCCPSNWFAATAGW